jgi:diguanylate cyclase (GGDEF)-like protein
MISLKKHIELHPGKLLEATLDAYGDALTAMGSSGARACPALGSDLKNQLAKIVARVSEEQTPESLTRDGKKAVQELEEWGGRAADYQKKKTAEVKEILVTLARTADVIAERDKRYAGQFGDLTGSLKAVANLDDLTRMRESILSSASKLSVYVERLTRESEQSVNLLRAELAKYQSRLDDAERLAAQDELTGVSNRRYAEGQIEVRIEKALPFCVLLLDLNGFKQVNDRYGHAAGDEVLKQFAGRLRTALRSSDVVARWGGDEFVAVLDCDGVQSATRIVSIHKKLAGGYQIEGLAGPIWVTLTAALGCAVWRSGDTLAALLERADEAMYLGKRDVRQNASTNTKQ